MKKRLPMLVLYLICLVLTSNPFAQAKPATMIFFVSMERPTTHYYHVVFRCAGLTGESHDFKMPAWTPGYYRIMDYAKNVVNFRATDGKGNALRWEKTSKNTWTVKSGQATSIDISYDVYAFTRFVAESYLNDDGGFISPASLFMYVAGRLNNPVVVIIQPYREWKQVSTGLERVEGKPNTFFARDFDALYDCPILIGNQEVLSFEAKGIPHFLVADNLQDINREKLVADLKRMVEAAVAIIGDIPYRHYHFLVIGSGAGGLEHLNSSALTLNPASLKNPSGYKRWLSFVAHEFFHLYNVKAIRPIALGPFDYDRENYTRMLWVSEGITVYYEYLILNRAGLLTRDEVLEQLRSIISRLEGSPGRLFQSATESSFDTWLHFFSRGEHTANTTISYYDKGALLGLLLDLKIRHETKNQASLDDVMRTLYQKFYKEKKRGFTDDEFRHVCENIAGVRLDEIFDVYASTVNEVDYPRYLAYAGLDIDLRDHELPSVSFGAITQDQGGNPVISRVEWNSPASISGLSAQDEIVAIDGVRVNSRTIEETLASRKPGDKIQILLSRRNTIQEVDVVLGKKTKRSFLIKPILKPNPLQEAILKTWLRDQ